MTAKLTRTDEIAAVLLILFSLGVYLASKPFPSGPTNAPGAGFFPQLIAAGISILAVIQFVKSVLDDANTSYSVTLTGISRVVIPIMLSAAFVLTMPLFGFLVGSMVFLIALMRYSGAQSYLTIVPVSIAVSLVLHYIFVEFLHVPLPESGILPVSRLLPSLALVVGGIS
ncbi:tripartite tricarboxylate transporter TctB family protein [Halocatena marina]|uniref:tripartite tricarboxylate transporter TctB family protein n=1 Tax=Halocatena marina TaxID=2934937 RepID=UPI00200E0599|nr:tripartite tricarboxylate transporter TctB family protein [Halocatena marina]